jgi:hypothetical protein
MTIKAAHTTNQDPNEAAQDLLRQLAGLEPRFSIFFASSSYEPEALGRALHDVLGGAPSIGCTTAGEIVSGRMSTNSVVLLGFDDAAVANAAVELVDDIRDRPAIERALERLAAGAGSSLRELDPARYVGLVLHDGMSVGEEAAMDAITDLTNVPFVGGSAGDDGKFQTTYVLANGRAKSGGIALALLKTVRPYAVLKTQSFDVLDEVLEVTRVDEPTRTVHELNGKPAAEEYARAIGTALTELATHFMTHPLGLVTSDGQPFVRSPQQVKGSDVVFYCQVKQGMQLRLLRSRDIVEDTRRDLDAKLAELGGCQGILNFHCILRTLELQKKMQMDAYGKLFERIPTAGFSTYGESYIGHINQTSTMVLFG